MQVIPSSSGIYVVSLSNEHPISVNANRPHADRCIFVTKAHCKFGRARDLARRHRDYVRTFGAGHVKFEVIVLTNSPAELEGAVAARLSHFRIRGSTGRLNEWLAGTTPATVKRIILEVAALQPASVTATSSTKSEQPRGRPLLPSRQSALNDGWTPDIAEAARYLKNAGMSSRLLKDLHHFVSRTETYASTLRYFSIRRDLRATNVGYGARLCYVEQAHRKRGWPFEPLVAEALAQYPLSERGGRQRR